VEWGGDWKGRKQGRGLRIDRCLFWSILDSLLTSFHQANHFP